MSSPQLHHCTNFESLCKIFSSGCFHPSFCLEQSNFMEEFSGGAYAVVCFADLLPDEVERHLQSFNSDSYIVMSKQWAIRNFLSPVVYYTKETVPPATMKHWINFFINNQEKIDIKGDEELLYKSTSLMFAYMKQYEGVYYDAKRDKFSDDKRTFYLEREWRWIPFVENGEAYYLPMNMFLNEDIRKQKKDELISHGYTLKFTLSDVVEVGVPQENIKNFKKQFRGDFKIVKL